MSQQNLNGSVLIYPLLNGDIAPNAAISANKLEQQEVVATDFGRDINGLPQNHEAIVYVSNGASELKTFKAMLYDTGTSTSVDFDLKVNGSSVLTAPITITNSSTDATFGSATITSYTLADGDVVSIECAVSSATGSHGPFAQVVIDDQYQG